MSQALLLYTCWCFNVVYRYILGVSDSAFPVLQQIAVATAPPLVAQPFSETGRRLAGSNQSMKLVLCGCPLAKVLGRPTDCFHSSPGNKRTDASHTAGTQ